MSRQQIYQIERAKWDKLATRGMENLEVDPNAEFFELARRSPKMIGVTEFLGDLHGKEVLDCGCGRGLTSTLLARSGAYVTAFDLSPVSAWVTRRRAQVSALDDAVQVTVAAGERLPFADNSFDVVFGLAVLHHLDASEGASELYRVLKPGGKAVFSEPMGMNPLLTFVRAYVPYPGKTPRGADIPLTYRDIRQWGQFFDYFRFREVQLLSMIERGWGFSKEFPTLRRLDDLLLKALPPLRRFCRYVVLYMQKQPAG